MVIPVVAETFKINKFLPIYFLTFFAFFSKFIFLWHIAHGCLVCLSVSVCVYSGYAFMLSIQAIHSCYLFQQFIHAIYSGNPFMLSIQAIHSCYLFRLSIQAIHSGDLFRRARLGGVPFRDWGVLFRAQPGGPLPSPTGGSSLCFGGTWTCCVLT